MKQPFVGTGDCMQHRCESKACMVRELQLSCMDLSVGLDILFEAGCEVARELSVEKGDMPCLRHQPLLLLLCKMLLGWDSHLGS